jgi:hypothetical protein
MADAPGSKRILLFPYDRNKSDPQTVIKVRHFCCIPIKQRIKRLRDEVQAEAIGARWEAKRYDWQVYFKDTIGDLRAVQDGVIYIVGHCGPGEQQISSAAHGNLFENEVKVWYFEVADILYEAGLRDFRGTFKVFACESARPDRDAPEAEAFAALFAKEAKKKWAGCTVLGYDGKVELGVRGQKEKGRTSFDQFGRPGRT